MDKSTFVGRKSLRSKGTEAPRGLAARRRLEEKLHLAQELVEVRQDRVVAVFLQSGESPPDPDGVNRLGRLNRDLQSAREALIDATCRWHSAMFMQKRAHAIRKQLAYIQFESGHEMEHREPNVPAGSRLSSSFLVSHNG